MNDQEYFPDEIDRGKLTRCAEEWADAWPFITKIVLYKTRRGVADIDKRISAYTLVFVVDDITAATGEDKFPYDTLVPIQNSLHECGKSVSWNTFTVDIAKFENLAGDPIMDFILPKYLWTLYPRDNVASPIEITPAIKQTDSEELIRSVSISFVNNTTVSIKVGNNKAKEYACGEMGFRAKSNTWKLLIKVLKDTGHAYHVGIYPFDKDPAKVKAYNSQVQLLGNFSKKFVSFLNKEYAASLPPKFSVFKNMKGYERAGTYNAKFHIRDDYENIQASDIKHLSKQEVFKRIDTLINARRHARDDETKDRLLITIGTYAEHAAKNGWITEEQMRNMLSSSDEEPSPDDVLSHAQSAFSDDYLSPEKRATSSDLPSSEESPIYD